MPRLPTADEVWRERLSRAHLAAIRREPADPEFDRKLWSVSSWLLTLRARCERHLAGTDERGIAVWKPNPLHDAPQEEVDAAILKVLDDMGEVLEIGRGPA